MGWEDDLYTIQETEFVNFLLTNDKIHLFPADLISRICISKIKIYKHLLFSFNLAFFV